MSARATGSTPVSGSSSTSRSGSCTIAVASLVRWRMPLENPRTRRFAARGHPHRARSPRRRALPRLAARHAGELGHVGHQLERGQLVPGLLVLRGVADAAPHRDVVERARAEHRDRAARRAEQARHHLDQGRLAGAVGAEQPHDAAARASSSRRTRRARGRTTCCTCRRVTHRPAHVAPPTPAFCAVEQLVPSMRPIASVTWPAIDQRDGQALIDTMPG